METMKIARLAVRDSNAVQSWTTAQGEVPDHAGCYFFSKGVIYPDTYRQESAEAVRQATVDVFLNGHQKGCEERATWFANILWFAHKEGYFTQEQMEEVFDAVVWKTSDSYRGAFLSRSGFCDTDVYEQWLARYEGTADITPVKQWLRFSGNLTGTVAWLSANLDHDRWDELVSTWHKNPARWDQQELARVVETSPAELAFRIPEHDDERRLQAGVGMEILRSWKVWEAWLHRFQGAGLEDEKTLAAFLKTLTKSIDSGSDDSSSRYLTQVKAEELLALSRIFTRDENGELQYNHAQERSLTDFLYILHVASTPLTNQPWLNIWPVLQHEPHLLQFPFMYIMDAVSDAALISPDLLLHGSPPDDIAHYEQVEQRIGHRGVKSRAAGWREELWVQRWADADVQAYLAAQDPKLVHLAPEWSFQMLAPESVLLENKLGSVQYAAQKKAGSS